MRLLDTQFEAEKERHILLCRGVVIKRNVRTEEAGKVDFPVLDETISISSVGISEVIISWLEFSMKVLRSYIVIVFT